jgi:RNase H-like domain found in reverse transcriptase
MDDLVIPSCDEAENLQKLRRTLEVAADYGLEIKWKKCQFLRRRIEYLGYEIEDGKIFPSTSKTRAVKQFQEPKTVRQIQSFLGLAGYFRKFVQDFSAIAKPLSTLLKNNVKFDFGQQQREAFEKLKSILSDHPVLLIFRHEAETEVHCDASAFGYGSILMQKDVNDGQLHPVYYYSKTTTPTEQKYHWKYLR